MKELSNWSRLDHQNIVKIFDCNILPVPFLEMELCDDSLDTKQKPIKIQHASQIIFDISKGLKFAHENGIIHRDLKPQNILLLNEIPKITDWGLCKIITSSSSTKDKSYLSPLYASPEHISPKKFRNVDKRTDIWQLGVIFYELVTGKNPFAGEGFVEIASMITLNECKKPSEYINDAKKVDHIILKCLEKEKDKRYQSILDLQKDLSIVLKISYVESLKKSQSQQNFTKSGYYCGKLLKTMIAIENLPDSYKYANDLIYYVKDEQIKNELNGLIRELKERIDNNLGVEEQLIIRVNLLVHKITIK